MFRTEDGRFFTLAIAGQRGFIVPAKKQNDVASQEQSLFDELDITERPRSPLPPLPPVRQSGPVEAAASSLTQPPPPVTQVKSAPLEEVGSSLTAEEIIAARQRAIEDIIAARDRALQKTTSQRGSKSQRVVVTPKTR